MVLDETNLCRCTANIKIQKAGAKVFSSFPRYFPLLILALGGQGAARGAKAQSLT
jgi:hypothetical protein